MADRGDPGLKKKDLWPSGSLCAFVPQLSAPCFLLVSWVVLVDFSSGIHWPAGPNSPLTTGELAHLLSSDAALVSGPCFSNSDPGTLDLVMFYCQTFHGGLNTEWEVDTHVTDPPHFCLTGPAAPFFWDLEVTRFKVPLIIQLPPLWYSQSKNLKT